MEDQNATSVEEPQETEAQETEASTNEEPTNVWQREFEGHLRQWKSTLGELEVQMALGRAEASEKLEDLKETFRKFVAERKIELPEFNKESFNWDEVKAAFDELEVQLALGKMDLEDAYEEQKDKILTAIDSAKRGLKNAYDRIDDNFKEEAEEFRAKLEGYQVQFALGKYEAREALEEKKAELRTLVHEFRTKMDTVETTGEDKYDAFLQEMTKSYEHLKNAFASLLD